jgi:hypothetical protein
MKQEFDGYDILELMEHFNLTIPDSDEECDVALQSYLREHYEEEDVVSACRDYVKALYVESEKHLYSAPLWKGLSEVEDDDTFLRYFIQLVPMAWS